MQSSQIKDTKEDENLLVQHRQKKNLVTDIHQQQGHDTIKNIIVFDSFHALSTWILSDAILLVSMSSLAFSTKKWGDIESHSNGCEIFKNFKPPVRHHRVTTF